MAQTKRATAAGWKNYPTKYFRALIGDQLILRLENCEQLTNVWASKLWNVRSGAAGLLWGSWILDRAIFRKSYKEKGDSENAAIETEPIIAAISPFQKKNVSFQNRSIEWNGQKRKDEFL